MSPWPVEEDGRARSTCRAPATPTWSGSGSTGRRDVRNMLERASRARDRRACRRRRAVQGVPRAPSASRSTRTSPDRLRPAPRARAAAAPLRTSPGSTPRRCAASTPRRAAAMVAEIDALRKANESLGGVFEVQAFGLVPGLGSHISWEERLDGRLAMAICSIQAIKGGRDRRRLRGRRPAGLAGPRRDLLLRASAATTAQTNRSGGLEGGMTTGDAAGRSRRDEAAADADQAAALGRHRDPRAGAGAARAHRLLHRSRGRGGRRGDGRVRARRRLPAQVRRRPHRRRRARPCAPTRSGSDGAAERVRARASSDRLHGRRQDDGRPEAAQRRSGRAARQRRLLEERVGRPISEHVRDRRRGRPSGSSRSGSCSSCSTAPASGGDRARWRQRRSPSACATGARRPRRRCCSTSDADRPGSAVAGAGAGERPLARGPRGFGALHAAAHVRSMSSCADAFLPAPARGEAAACSTPCERSAGHPPARGCCGRARPRASTRCWSAAGCSGSPARRTALLAAGAASSRAFCVSDETVAALYGERLGDLAEI